MHGRPRLRGARVALTLAVLAALATVAVVLLRHRPVEVSVPAHGSDPACARMAAELPEQLLHEARVATSVSSPAVAAWGDPAIIWRCGVEPPGPTIEVCQAVNGVDWVVDPLDDGTGFTTYGRSPAVQVLVPKAYAPEAFALTALSAAVSQVPQGDHRCS
ncbi:MAG TPA: DUF3515 family protein [Actinomycetales bacterium]|nr:DUF3515 family protein [Actinomycetales bacterium]